MDYIIPCLVACLASLLTFFSGFGLGTLLTPVFAIFFPIDIAIASTALVHFFNNIFKFAITAKHINKRVLFEFGLPSFFAATGGAFMLFFLADTDVLFTYHLAHHEFEITIMKSAIGVMIILFSVLENLKSKSIEKKSLFFGGLLSGFCGGLSGNQGALRSMFLNSIQLKKESYIATGVAIACFTDMARLGVYYKTMSFAHTDTKLIAFATMAAMIGAIIGKNLLSKTTDHFINKFVQVFLIIMGTLLCFGWV
jgi:uncharacterized membrane protein YfcA